MDKEKWIHEVMQSLHQRQQADVPGTLNNLVQNKIAVNVPAAKIVKMKWAAAAAAACVLLLLNVWAINKWQQQKQPTATSSTMVYNESLTPDFSITKN